MTNNMTDKHKKKILQFIYDRMVNLYHENPNVDYMMSFNEIINSPVEVSKVTEEYLKEQLDKYKDIPVIVQK